MTSSAVAWALGQVEAEKQADKIRQQRRKEELERLQRFFEENVDEEGNTKEMKNKSFERRRKNAKV